MQADGRRQPYSLPANANRALGLDLDALDGAYRNGVRVRIRCGRCRRWLGKVWPERDRGAGMVFQLAGQEMGTNTVRVRCACGADWNFARDRWARAYTAARELGCVCVLGIDLR